MNNTNKKIHKYVEDYCKLEKAPEYAILIKGKWGSGKTWFINELIKSFDEKKIKTLHISLYGMTGFTDIEEEFFRKLHPTLSSKKMMLLGKVAKGILKTAINVDLDGDGKKDGSISSAIPDFNLAEYFNNTENFVLFFDDVERCSIPINDLLGYINHFVEYGGYKVVLIANEEEIINSSDDGVKYRRIKEKLIGKTFEIEPEIGDALDSFLDSYPEHRRYKNIVSSKTLIQELYLQSGYKNLRHLKQAITEFGIFVSDLTVKAQENEELIKKLLINFLVFSFEIKSGNITPIEISKIKNSTLRRALKTTISTDEEKYVDISIKYSLFNSYELVLNADEWILILDKGIFDPKDIMITLESSQYLLDDKSPSWKKLWYALELEYEDVKELVKTVISEYDNREYKHQQIVMHVLGIFLQLKKIGIIKKNNETLVKEAKKYIDYLFKNNLLIQPRSLVSHLYDSYDGLGYTEKNSNEFQIVKKYLDDSIENSKLKNMPHNAQELLQKLVQNPDEFCLNIHLCNRPENIYYNVPILKFIKPKDFVANFVKITQRSRWSVENVLEKRYAFDQFRRELQEEQSWLNIVSNLLNYKAKNSDPILKYNLMRSSEVFSKIANSLT